MQTYQWMQESDCTILGVEIARAKKGFQQILLTSTPATLTQIAQTTIPPYDSKAKWIETSKMKQ